MGYSDADRTSPLPPLIVMIDPSSMSFKALGSDIAGIPYSRERHEKCPSIPPVCATTPLTMLKADVQPGSVP